MAKLKGLSKAHKTIVADTVKRWEDTINVGTPNLELAQTYIRAGYAGGIGAFRKDKHKEIKNIEFHFVDSIAAFMIAIAVVRGRMTKKSAYDLCKQLDISNSFIDKLRKDSLCSWNSHHRNWRWARLNTEFTRTWLRAIHEEYTQHEQLVANTPGFWRRWWSSRNNQRDDALMLRVNQAETFTRYLTSWLIEAMGADVKQSQTTDWSGRPRTITTRPADDRRREILQELLPDSRTTLAIMGQLVDAVDVQKIASAEPPDTIADGGLFLDVAPNAIDAEILCKILKIDDPNCTWEHELFHHITNFAAFQKSCVVLASRPTLTLNDEGNLHNTTGPAAYWADGLKLYFNDGHFMEEYGKTIVTAPENLSLQKILQIRNQETRRLAIDAFGWDRFIVEADCPILDRRQNDIDNTIEMLVGPPQAEQAAGSTASYVMLFCRSTGRRYFLAVPRDVNTCDDAQRWMANSGANTSLSYANKPMRLVGAS